MIKDLEPTRDGHVVTPHSLLLALAFIVTIVDWSKAFDRQSLIENGVRSSLIPILISLFQNINMKQTIVLQAPSPKPATGPEGCLEGQQEL